MHQSNPLQSSEYALLGILYSKPTHGYDLHKSIANPDGIGLIWGVKMANMYAQLEKLEKNGLITGTLVTSETRPARRQYEITASGKTAFESWLTAVVEHPRDFRQEFMLKLYFVEEYQPGQLVDLIKMQLEECKNWRNHTIERNELIEPEHGFTRWVGEFRASQIKSQVDWLNWLLIQPRVKKTSLQENH